MRAFPGCILLVATGCGGASIGPGPGDDTGTTGGSGGSPSHAGSGPSGGSAPAQPGRCGEPGDVIALQSPDHVLEHLIGSWVHCSGVMMFGVAHDGMEIAADGSFYFLKADASGALARQKGFDGGGTWLLTDNYANGPGVYQVNFDMVPGQNMAFPAFQSNPSAMRLSLVPAGMADYVAVE